MAIRVHSSGPACVYVYELVRNNFGAWGVNPASGTILGWCEVSPRLTYNTLVAPLFNTMGGVELPYEYYPQGSSAVIECTFTRWNDRLLLLLERLRTFQTPISTYCAPVPLVLGVTLLVVYPLHAVIGDSELRIAEVFPNVVLMRVMRNQMTTAGESVTVLFRAVPLHLAKEPGPDVLMATATGAPWLTQSMVGYRIVNNKLGTITLCTTTTTVDTPNVTVNQTLINALTTFTSL